MAKKRSPHILKELSLQAVSKTIRNTCQNVIERNCENEDEVSVCIEVFISSIPFQLVDDVFQEVLPTLGNCQVKLASPGYENACNAMNTIITLFCESRVIYLNIKNVDKLLREKIVQCLHHMTGLRYLNFGEEKCEIAAILGGISQMPNLTTYIQHNECTDEVISVLVQNCKQLRVLEICGSEEVTDAGMSEIHECQSLRYLNVEETSVTGSSCAAAIKNIAGLKLIGYTTFREVLQNLQEFRHMNIEVLKGNISIPELSVVEKVFPSLEEITVAIEDGELHNDFIPVLTKVKTLEIRYSSSSNESVNKILHTYGPYLRKLILSSNYDIKLDVVSHIEKYCSDLTELKVNGRLYFHNPELVLPYTGTRSATLPKLEALLINCVSIHIEYFLSLSRNITTLYIALIPRLSVDSVIKMITRNELTHLKEFHFLQFYIQIDVACIYKILQSLESLKLLECFVNEKDIPELETYITQNNLNVAIYLRNCRVYVPKDMQKTYLQSCKYIDQ